MCELPREPSRSLAECASAGSPDRLTFARAGTRTTAVVSAECRAARRDCRRDRQRMAVRPRCTRDTEGRDQRLAARAALAAHAHEPAAPGAERARIQCQAGALLPERGPAGRACRARHPPAYPRAAPARRPPAQPWRSGVSSTSVGAPLPRLRRSATKAAASAAAGPSPGTSSTATGKRSRRRSRPSAWACQNGNAPPAASTGSVASRPMPVSSATAAKPRGVSPEAPRKASTSPAPSAAEHVARDAQLAAQRLAVDLGRAMRTRRRRSDRSRRRRRAGPSSSGPPATPPATTSAEAARIGAHELARARARRAWRPRASAR